MSALTRSMSHRLFSVCITLIITTCLSIPTLASQTSSDTDSDSTTTSDTKTKAVELEIEEDRNVVENEDGTKTINSVRTTTNTQTGDSRMTETSSTVQKNEDGSKTISTTGTASNTKNDNIKTINGTNNVTKTDTGRQFDRTRNVNNSNGSYKEEQAKGTVTRNADGTWSRNADVQGARTNAKGKTTTYNADRSANFKRNADGSVSFKGTETRINSKGKTTRTDVQGTSKREGNKIKRTSTVNRTKSGGKPRKSD